MGITGLFFRPYSHNEADYPQSVDMPLSVATAAAGNVANDVDSVNDEYAQAARNIAGTVGSFLTNAALGTRTLESNSTEPIQDASDDTSSAKPLWTSPRNFSE